MPLAAPCGINARVLITASGSSKPNETSCRSLSPHRQDASRSCCPININLWRLRPSASIAAASGSWRAICRAWQIAHSKHRSAETPTSETSARTPLPTALSSSISTISTKPIVHPSSGTSRGLPLLSSWLRAEEGSRRNARAPPLPPSLRLTATPSRNWRRCPSLTLCATACAT